MHSLLGSTFVDRYGQVVAPATLAGKVVALYFSAHWCPPCRAFTPALVAAYAAAGNGTSFEIVFVSSDRDPRSYVEYYGTMPWLAVPYAAVETKAKLSAAYAVRGIPALLLFDPAGKLITREGVRLVTSGGLGEVLDEVLARTPRRSFPDMLAALGVAAPRILLYFSNTGHIRNPKFDMLLEMWASAHPDTAAGVYIPTHTTWAGSGPSSGPSGPWPVLPPGREASALAATYGVDARPALVLVDATGTVLCRHAKVRVETEPEGFPWAARPCENLPAAAEDMNEVATLVLFLDKLTDAGLAATLEAAFRAAAAACWGTAGAPCFALTTASDEATERLRLYGNLARDRDGPASYRLVYFQLAAGKMTVWGHDFHPDTAAAILDFLGLG